uniref:Uncharacterized protein n=1 Tax=Arundo donax TaxID=35708 RepID=A0A0A9EVR5_ARUDO
MIATTLFRRFRANTVSSEFTLAVRSSGPDICPSATVVIRQGFEVLRISLLNLQHKPEASSTLKVTGISIATR